MLTNKELSSLLDQNNPRTYFLESAFGTLRDERFVVERKGKDLLDVVKRLRDQRLYPVVDKKLGLVLGAEGGCHKLLCTELFRYHYHSNDPSDELPYVSVFEAADRYIDDGHGYYISSLRSASIVVSEKYVRDRHDEDLFRSYALDEI